MEKVEQLQNLRSAFTKNNVAELLLRSVLFVQVLPQNSRLKKILIFKAYVSKLKLQKKT